MSNPDALTGLLLAREEVGIQFDGASQSYLCNITFDLRRSNTLMVEPLESIDAICFGFALGKPFNLQISGVRTPVECIAESVTAQMGEERTETLVTLVPRFSLVERDRASTLMRINAGVLNLPYQFHVRSGPSRLGLAHEDWEAELLPVTEHTMLFDPSIQNREYVFTHHLSLRRVNNTPFTCAEGHEQLALMSTFFSFCHGHWVSTALSDGINESGLVVMEEWGTRKLSPWCEPMGWLDQHHGNSMADLFPGFMRRMSDPNWRELMQQVIYWYLRGDTNDIGPDGACILLQVALERLAWHMLVRDRHSISQAGFLKLPAADRLRLLLATCGIPTGLPPELEQLNKAASALNWPDGPQSFCEIRNRLVHPPKKERAVGGLPYYDAYRLGKWYVELVILSACGYSGTYSNRTRKQRWVGQVEPVPWV